MGLSAYQWLLPPFPPLVILKDQLIHNKATKLITFSPPSNSLKCVSRISAKGFNFSRTVPRVTLLVKTEGGCQAVLTTVPWPTSFHPSSAEASGKPETLD
jgi:hypothetical protein